MGEIDRAIIETLLKGDDQRKRLYLTNAYYRAGLDAFVSQWLPVVLTGLEWGATQRDAENAENMRRMMLGLTTPEPSTKENPTDATDR